MMLKVILQELFFMDVRYNGGVNEPSLNIVDYLTSYLTKLVFIDLIDWHNNDPDEFELAEMMLFFHINRIEPFIDFPQLVDLIYVNQDEVF